MADHVLSAESAARQAVVPLPEHVDVSNAAHIYQQLLAAINHGADVVIADMSGTLSCDHAGIDAVASAYQRAVISQAELRLVISAPAVRRLVADQALDRLVRVYTSVTAAIAAGVPGGGSPSPGDDLLTQVLVPPAAARSRAGPGGPGRAQVDEAVLRQLIDALDDGIALVDDDGTIVLASRRLTEMFGYEAGELTGRPVESLVPAELRDTHRQDRAAYALKPVSRPMAGRARLVGVRKDGATVPVTITLSPVFTASGHLVVAVVRDSARVRRRDDLTSLAMAAAARYAQNSQELLDQVVRSLFHVGLSMQDAAGQPEEAARERITEALRRLDDTIHEIREHVFRARRPGGATGRRS